MIEKKTNSERLVTKNKEELKYITAKYRSFFELNYFKFLGKDLLKSLLELTEGAKVSFKEYFKNDDKDANETLIEKCLGGHRNMIYGNKNKLNSYGYNNENIMNLAQKVSKTLQGSFAGNPIPFNDESAKEIINNLI